jgi:hypothetical protein
VIFHEEHRIVFAIQLRPRRLICAYKTLNSLWHGRDAPVDDWDETSWDWHDDSWDWDDDDAWEDVGWAAGDWGTEEVSCSR